MVLFLHWIWCLTPANSSFQLLKSLCFRFLQTWVVLFGRRRVAGRVCEEKRGERSATRRSPLSFPPVADRQTRRSSCEPSVRRVGSRQAAAPRSQALWSHTRLSTTCLRLLWSAVDSCPFLSGQRFHFCSDCFSLPHSPNLRTLPEPSRCSWVECQSDLTSCIIPLWFRVGLCSPVLPWV